LLDQKEACLKIIKSFKTLFYETLSQIDKELHYTSSNITIDDIKYATGSYYNDLTTNITNIKSQETYYIKVKLHKYKLTKAEVNDYAIETDVS
jgi:hypothetical protein